MHNENQINQNPNYFANLLHDIKVSMRGEPHSLDEIVISMEEAKQDLDDFLDLLVDHHGYLRESIVVLLDKDAQRVEKQFHLDRFLTLLDMHGHAEEATLYNCLVKNTSKDARLEGLSGRDEHLLAYQLAEELRSAGFEKEWTEDVNAKAKVLAGLLLNHIKEEEDEMFPTAKREIPSNELNLLINDYVDLCKGRLEVGSFRPERSLTN